MTYRRVYTSNGIVAWAPDGSASDHLFVFVDPNPGDVTATPAVVFGKWAAAPFLLSPSGILGVRQRALLFCRKFDLTTISAALDTFKPLLPQGWGQMLYWRQPTFDGTLFNTTLPFDSNLLVSIASYSLSCEVPTPSLDDLNIDLKETSLSLALKKPQRLFIGGVAFQSNEVDLTVSLTAVGDLTSGAICTSVPWPTDTESDHPLRRVGFFYQTGLAAGQPAPQPGDEPVPIPFWMAELADKVAPADGEKLLVHLDPRDAGSAQWLDGKCNSRMHFGGSTLHSSFFGTRAQRFRLKSAGTGQARLGFISSLLLDDGSIGGGDTIFHPEGTWEISPAPATGLNDVAVADPAIGAADLIAGTTATEFLDLSSVNRVEFVPGPAFLKAITGNEAGSLEDKNGKSRTAHARFSSEQVATPAIDYHSQPAHAPLFINPLSGTHLADASAPPGDLQRRRVAYGVVPGDPLKERSIPLFPWAGYKPGNHYALPTGSDNSVALQSFEATHLAQVRRDRSPQLPVALAAAPIASLAVTQQGLLAEVEGDSSRISKLYFGNPNSLKPDGVEFHITITNTQDKFYNDLQQALASSQLFMVFDQVDAATSTITLDGAITIRDFAFEVNVTSSGPSTSLRTVVLVKYFRGRSLQDLVSDPHLWACREQLAKTGDSKGIAAMVEQNTDSANLQKIWKDSDWQGLLVLNLPTGSVPDVVELLKAGISGKLLAQYAGLNFLPVKQADIVGGAVPLRVGSAFGSVQYKRQAVPDPPLPQADTRDVEPGSAGDGGRKYSFVVNTLNIEFQNSQITTFAANIGVGVSHLFWDKIQGITADPPQPDSTLTMIGSYECRRNPDNTSEDVFSLRTTSQYLIQFPDSTLLDTLKLGRAQLSVVSSARDGNKKLTRLTTFIGFDGQLNLRQKALPVPFIELNGLTLTNFGLELTWEPVASSFGIRFKADGITANIDFNLSGAASLMQLLPVKLKGMNIAIGGLPTLEGIGFKPINIGGFSGSGFHFGIVFELDLGSLGNLSGDSGGLRLPMIFGWRGGTNPGICFGIQFPQFNGSVDIGIQQFIRLRAKTLTLESCKDPSGKITALAIRIVDGRIVMLGTEWPSNVDTANRHYFPVQLNS